MAAPDIASPLDLEHVAPLLTAHEVADVLGVGLRTIRRMVRRGELPIVRIGRRSIRFRPEDIKALIERGYVSQKAG
jgi:excisionase family DNA binding protein